MNVQSNVRGDWAVTIPAHSVTWHTELRVVSGSEQVSTMVNFGVVILCSGQRYVFH